MLTYSYAEIMEANASYRQACYHDSHYPKEPSAKDALTERVRGARRQYDREHRRGQRSAQRAAPLITIKPIDGIVDNEAVDRAVRGLPVILTAIEASLAIVRMHALEVPRDVIAKRFGMAVKEASRFCPFHGGWGNLQER
jgi:hypothetical protein